MPLAPQRPELKHPAGDMTIPISNETRVQTEQLLASTAMTQHQDLRQAVYALLTLTLEDVSMATPTSVSADGLKRLQEHAIQLLQQLPSDHTLLGAFEEACTTPAAEGAGVTADASASVSELTREMEAMRMNSSSSLHALVHAPIRLQAIPFVDSMDDDDASGVALAGPISAF